MSSWAHQHFPMMARYNRWANARVYAAAEVLSDEAYRADGGAFFGSVHATLNHLIVTDRIWMGRFVGEPSAHTQLDEKPYDTLPELKAAREAEDARILAFVGGLDEGALSGTFTYQPVTNPRDITQPLAPALAHLFNHHTHHRGQVHALMTRFAGEAPSLDLIYYQRETGDGMS